MLKLEYLKIKITRKGKSKYSVDLYKLVGREGNCLIVENDEGEKLRRRLKPAELQIIKLLIIK